MKTLSELLSSAYSPIPHRALKPGECQTLHQKRCTLCFAGRIDYAVELQRKQKAIDEFWNGLKLPIRMDPIVASPLGRNYRTVSKRKAFLMNRTFTLGLIGVDDDTSKSFPMNVGQCMIEPLLHGEVYRLLQEYLQRKEHLSLAEEFNYIIVKGSDAEAIVILNMNHFSSSNRKEVNQLSKHLSARVKNLTGIFVFVDEERSRYYLSGSPRQGDRINPKPLVKIFGKEKLFHKIGETKFLYSPLSFSQTNHSVLESFMESAREMLDLKSEDILYDLYCGYGLFSLCLAKHAKNIVGAELSRSSIADAGENVRINKTSNVKFLTADISRDSLRRLFHQKHRQPSLKLILDPPRSGTGEDVIKFIADQQPERVLHIFCNPDIIEPELQRWKACGYAPLHARPFDMFPGTCDVEIMVSLGKSPHASIAGHG